MNPPLRIAVLALVAAGLALERFSNCYAPKPQPLSSFFLKEKAASHDLCKGYIDWRTALTISSRDWTLQPAHTPAHHLLLRIRIDCVHGHSLLFELGPAPLERRVGWIKSTHQPGNLGD
jgi:hypothetical protein